MVFLYRSPEAIEAGDYNCVIVDDDSTNAVDIDTDALDPMRVLATRMHNF